MSEHFDTAQICRNGHLVTDRYNGYPARRKKFCDECGEPTITQCEACGENVRGDDVSDVPITNCAVPNYCHACGKPFPWTLKKLEAAKEWVEELVGLDEGERQAMKQSLDEIVRNTPKTEVASLRLKKLMKKVGVESYDALKKVLTGLVSEALKKTLLGP